MLLLLLLVWGLLLAGSVPNNVLCVFCFPYSCLSYDMKKTQWNSIAECATQDGFVPVLMTW